MARELGLEPRMTESKSVVLPLHYSRTKTIWWMRVESNYHLTPYEGGALPLCYSSIGVSNENRTRDSGITTRGFATKLWTP